MIVQYRHFEVPPPAMPSIKTTMSTAGCELKELTWEKSLSARAPDFPTLDFVPL
jgi:hypothetical protein